MKNIIKELNTLDYMPIMQVDDSLKIYSEQDRFAKKRESATALIKRVGLPKLSKVADISFDGLNYANEADILNIALFGMTAKEWKEKNPTLNGNIRDEATTEQLLVLSNLENLNAEFIKLGMDKQERLKRLNEAAIHQMGLIETTRWRSI